jgi:hypothetical protein
MKHREDNIEANLVVHHAQHSVWYGHLDGTTFCPEGPECRIRKEPISTSIDAHGDDSMASLNEGIVDRHGRRARNLMFGRTSAEEKEYPGHQHRLPWEPTW